jgi:hypothetical protein
MWVTKIFTVALVSLTGLLPSSCSKSKSAAAQHQPAANVANSPVNQAAKVDPTQKNLGELDLTNHYETFVNLGAGKSCIIRPTAINRSKLQLTMSVESKGPNGKTRDLSVVQVVAKAGTPFEVAVGDMNLTLTPVITGE